MKTFKKWYPSGTKRAIARKRCLWRQHKAPCDGTMEVAYRKAAPIQKQLIHKFELKNEQKVIESNNVGSFYNLVNKKLTNKKGIGALRNSANDVIH